MLVHAILHKPLIQVKLMGYGFDPFGSWSPSHHRQFADKSLMLASQLHKVPTPNTLRDSRRTDHSVGQAATTTTLCVYLTPNPYIPPDSSTEDCLVDLAQF